MQAFAKTNLEDLLSIPFIPSYYATREDFLHPHEFLKRLFKEIITNVI
jgi:hypothetical protein